VDGADATWRGRSFQTVAPETGNARLSTVERIQFTSNLNNSNNNNNIDKDSDSIAQVTTLSAVGSRDPCLVPPEVNGANSG